MIADSPSPLYPALDTHTSHPTQARLSLSSSVKTDHLYPTVYKDPFISFSFKDYHLAYKTAEETSTLDKSLHMNINTLTSFTLTPKKLVVHQLLRRNDYTCNHWKTIAEPGFSFHVSRQRKPPQLRSSALPLRTEPRIYLTQLARHGSLPAA